MAEGKELQNSKNYGSTLTKVQNYYMNEIEKQFDDHEIALNDYQKTCLRNAIMSIYNVLNAAKLNFGSPELDKSSLTAVLQQVAAFELNAAAMPREIYFKVESYKTGDDKWAKRLAAAIEGDGNDKLLRKFGQNIDEVGSPWLVRENDEFSFPKYIGFDVTPPTWSPSGKGKVIRVVYPIRLKTGGFQYLMAERDDVKPNLLAHINNNMLNETFGIAQSRYKASQAEKEKIDAKKRELMALTVNKTLDEILDDTTLAPWISVAWREPQSKEAMIVRKMRNNAVKNYPKEFSNAFITEVYANNDSDVKELQETIDSTPKKTIRVIDGEVVDGAASSTTQLDDSDTGLDSLLSAAEEV